MLHNTAQNSSDNIHSYPPDNHHSSDVVYRRGWGRRWEGFVKQLSFYLEWKREAVMDGESGADKDNELAV